MTKSTESLHSSWHALREQVEAALERAMHLDGECPSRLSEAMAYSLHAGGKRLRPVLVLMACEACGGNLEDAMPAACAIEMVHTYSLIHDDLPAMDDDDYRRGRLTNHKVFGEAMGILAGDGLLTLAAGARGMVGGQVADLEAESRSTSGSKVMAGETAVEHESDQQTRAARATELEAIHRRKTGRLIRSALTLGGRIAQADVATLGVLDHYGTCIGLAFQIADDVLDVTGTQDKLGKGVGKDAGLGKLTYPSLIGLERSRQKAQDLINEACLAIAPWGERGQKLQAMARFVLERDH